MKRLNDPTEGSDEKMGRDAGFGRYFGFQSLGIHHVRVTLGRRTSLSHAESAEDGFIFVIDGTPATC